MSSNWPPEVQAQMGGNSVHQHSAPQPVRRGTNPPPVCFNCGGEHFLVDCPQSSNRATPADSGFVSAPAPVPYQQPQGPAPPPQSFPPQSGPAQYSSYPQNQQYGPPASHYPYTQPQQAQQPYTAPYNAPPPTQQYPRPAFQTPTYNQYNQNNAPQQSNSPAYQPPAPQYNARGPSPYQAPVTNYAPQSSGYRGGYQSVPNSAPYQPPPPQWNNTPSSSQPPFQNPPRSNSGFQREFSGTPSHYSQPQQQRPRAQSQQMEYTHQTPQTPSSNSGKVHQASYQGSPAKPMVASVPSTPASHLNVRRSSTVTSTLGNVKSEQTGATDKFEKAISPEQEAEEGEVREGDDEEELFNWELEKIFKEPPPAETVALAQPLSAGYESTPVPLVQAWTTSVPSISRYARKDNMKEFIRSVRVAPQWSYLQEDPAFAEVNDEGPLIPLGDLWAWMDIHHGRAITVVEAADPEPTSKKRSRPEGEIAELEDEQENVDQQIALEVANEEVAEEPPNKRQKNEDAEDPDEIMRSPGGRTPIISGRGGTPCMPTSDDAWAPQPGECATSPGDPTENLLASLGVSGDPKPVKKETLPPYVSAEEFNTSPGLSQYQAPFTTELPPFQGPVSNVSGPNTQNMPQNMPQNHGLPMASAPQANPQYGPPMNTSYGNGNMQNPQYGQGPPTGISPQGPPQGPPQYGPPMNAPYASNPPQNMHGHPQYDPLVNAPYGNGPPSNYSQGPPQGPPQWGPQRTPSYGNAPQYTAPQQYPQYAPPQNQPYSNPQYGPPVNQYPSAPTSQYPQGPQYNNQIRQPSYGSGQPIPGQYGPMTQSSPTQYGPPQNVPYNAAPYQNQVQYQNGPVVGYGNAPSNMPPNNQQYPNMAPNTNMPLNQPQYGNGPNGVPPPRQDSGYVSARGSYSSGSGPNAFNNQAGPQNSSQPQQGQPQPLSDTVNRQGPLHQVQESGVPAKMERSSSNSNQSFESNENAGSSPGTPLSPTSAELLGKLEPKTKPIKVKTSARKVKKRPQPVVAAAYSRRW